MALVKDFSASHKEEHHERTRIFKNWRLNADIFVSECMGINDSNGFRATVNQQVPALKAISELAYAKGIVYDYEHGQENKWLLKHGQPTERMFELSKKIGISIMAGRNTGKDAFASWVGMWFNCMHIYSTKVFCIAPTERQLKAVLWSEFGLWHGMRSRNSDEMMFQLRPLVHIEAEKIYLKGLINEKSTNFIFYGTPQRNVDKEQMKKTLSGIHADNLLVIGDEASGIDDVILEELEVTLMGRRNLALLIGNPHKPYGYFHDTHFGKYSDQWIKFHWDSEDCELVSKTHIENEESKFGRNSDHFRVNINGLPPLGGDDTFLPYQWIYESCMREIDVPPKTKIVVGIDVAGSGVDMTIVTVRHGNKVLEQFSIPFGDTYAQSDEIEKFLRVKYGKYEISYICVETDGMGSGLYDRLCRVYPSLVRAVQMGSKPIDGRRYGNKKAELWGKLRKSFEDGVIDIPNDTELREELCAIKHTVDKQGRIIMGPKSEIKKRLGRSCDKADSLVLTFVIDLISLESTSTDTYRLRGEPTMIPHNLLLKNSFMGV